MDGSFVGDADHAAPKVALFYRRLDVNRSGLADRDAADLSAGRSVFLPWGRPAVPPRPVAKIVAPIGGLQVLVAARQVDGLAGLVARFRTTGARVAMGADLAVMLARIVGSPKTCGCLVVQIDGFGEIEDIVDQVMAFRRNAPTVPLILISTGFRQDRLGAERLALCDVSLRDPVNLGQVQAAVEQALQNNLLWQERLHSLCVFRTDAPRKITPRRVKPVPASVRLG
jgi:hypothetical protein